MKLIVPVLAVVLGGCGASHKCACDEATPPRPLALPAPTASSPSAVAAAHVCIDVSSWGQPITPDYIAELAAAGQAKPSSSEGACYLPTLWRRGREVRVAFLGNPSESLRVKIKDHAAEWSKHANLKFKFVDDSNASDVRVSFEPGGSWSAVGIEALRYPKNTPTLNLGWITETTDNTEVRRVVLHEFGHAVGLAHEHQNPIANIPWKKDAVYAAYGGSPNYWTPKQIEVNVIERMTKRQTVYSSFDNSSIMLYPIPADLLTDPHFKTELNTELSDGDKRFVSLVYPK